MKKIATGFFTVLLLASTLQPSWARSCPKLIKEGRDLLAKSKFSKTDADKVRTLLNEADKAHDGGDHTESMKKAKEALSVLKKS